MACNARYFALPGPGCRCHLMARYSVQPGSIDFQCEAEKAHSQVHKWGRVQGTRRTIIYTDCLQSPDLDCAEYLPSAIRFMQFSFPAQQTLAFKIEFLSSNLQRFRGRLWAICVMGLGGIHAQMAMCMKENGTRACGMAQAWPLLPEVSSMRATSCTTVPQGMRLMADKNSSGLLQSC